MPTENTAVCRECGRHYELPGSPSCGHSQAPPPDSPLGQLLSSFKLRGEPSAALLDELAQEKSARADAEAKFAAAQEENARLADNRDAWVLLATQAQERADCLEQELQQAEANLTRLVEAEEGYRASERLMLRRLSDAASGGSASTWDEVLHAVEALQQACGCRNLGDGTGTECAAHEEQRNDKEMAEEAAAKWRDELAAAKVALQQAGEREQTTEQRLRQELWLNHGHDGLYGDDGEMQCGRCLPVFDYKRAPLADVIAAADKARLERLAKAIASPSPTPEPHA